MKQKKETYDILIEIGSEAFRQKGYANTGIQEIIDKAKTSKGGFYHYFKNKEDFAIQVLNVHTNNIIQGLEKLVNTHQGTPLDKIKGALLARIEHFDQINYKRGSLLMQMLTEASASKSPLLKMVNRCYDQLYDFIALHLSMAQKLGELKSTGKYTTRELAIFIYSGFEGALVKARADRSRYVLDVYTQFLFAFLDELKTNYK